jgi:MSHA pilin protein MshC
MQGRSSYAGFTLVELVMTLVLIGILAVAVFPRAPSTSIATRPQAEQVMADLRYVQMLSMTSGVRHCMQFTANGYRLRRGATCDTDVNHPAGLAQPIVLPNVSVSVSNLPNQYVAFNGLGVPLTNNAAAPTLLASNAVVTMAGDGDTATITISPQTGRAVTGP